MSEEYTILTISVIEGELSLLNSHINRTDQSTARQIELFVDSKIDGYLDDNSLSIRDVNTYKEVFDSMTSIKWKYYRYIKNDEGDSLCVGVLDE